MSDAYDPEPDYDKPDAFEASPPTDEEVAHARQLADPQWRSGFKEGESWGAARAADPSLDLRWVLVGQSTAFIRGFSAGLAAYRER